MRKFLLALLVPVLVACVSGTSLATPTPTPTPARVPEPTTLVFLCLGVLGVLGLGFLSQRRGRA